jgi:endonuclease YncB( thermonuclease family)
MKHYYDRPYMMSSSEGENIPFIGPLFGATVGRLIKPRLKMHQEYWAQNGASEYNNEVAKQIASTGIVGSGSTVASGQGEADTEAVIDAKSDAVTSDIPVPIKIKALDQKSLRDNSYELYTTPSGTQQVVNVDENISLFEVNEQLKSYSMKKVLDGNKQGASMRVDSSQDGVARVPNNEPIINADNMGYALGEQFNQWSEIAGIYGFTAQGFLTGEANENKRVIETSGYTYSINRKFWDENLGGLGGELSELFRRFIPKRRKDVEYINPIRNTMPEWMPGEDYFTDFQHGDPYSKVPKGEMRLPGEGYERMWNIDNPMDLKIGSSFIGKSKTDIVKHLLKMDTILDEDAQDIVDEGSDMHKKIEQEWLKEGIAIDTEGKIEDKENGILGFYDAIILDESSKTGQAVVDIKTVSAKSFEKIKKEGVPKDLHQKQVNYYLWATNNEESKGYIHYVNRDNPEETMTMGFNYSQDMLDETLKTLGEAREYVRKGISEGVISRADMYDPIDKMRILADVAPYSKEFQEAAAVVSRMKLNSKQQEEVSAINERVREQKQAMRIYPYKFKTANIEYEKVHVSKIIDNNTFLTEEHPDNPIRFAGVHISEDQASGNKEAAAEELSRFIREGSTITIGIDPDPVNQKANDTMNTIHAVVYKGNTNVNRRMLNMGLASEKEDDYSPTGVHARFSDLEITFGSIWESIAHFNSSVNTKLLQVRSAAEDYERREVYGKNFQQWTHPVRDYLVPAIRENLARPSGLLWGTLLGAAFGKTKYGRLVGATIGFSTTALGKMIVGAGEATSGEKWIPKVRQKERDLNEYIDVLKFVKYRRLYEQYAQKAMKENHFDVKAYMAKEKAIGEERKRRSDELNDFKKFIKLHYEDRKTYKFKSGKLPKYVDMDADLKTMISQINQEMNEIANSRKVTQLSPTATKAIEYYNKSEQTMYGYDPGESIMNVMKALPKKDRDYMKYFMDAPEEERPKILELAPKYMRRALESTWGIPVEDKETLQAYFERHQLPGADWRGWEEGTDLDSVKVKMIKKQDLDFSEFNVWQDQIDQANALGKVPLPHVNYRSNANEIRSKLIDMLGNIGLRDIEVEYTNSSKDVGVDVKINKDKRKEIEEKINNSRLV